MTRNTFIPIQEHSTYWHITLPGAQHFNLATHDSHDKTNATTPILVPKRPLNILFGYNRDEWISFGG